MNARARGENDVTNFYLRKKELGVELVDGLDVGKHVGEGLGREEVVRSVLLVHTKMKHLKNESKKLQINLILKFQLKCI